MTDSTLLPRRSPRRSMRRASAVAAVAIISVAGACSSGDGDDESGSATTASDAAPLTLPDDEGATDDTSAPSDDDADDAPAGWVEYEAEGISIDHPESWTPADNEQAAIVLMIDPEGMQFRRNINILVQTGGGDGTLADYVELSDEQLATAGTTVSDTGPTMLGDEPAHQWRYTTNTSGVDVEVLTLVAVKNGSAYLATYTSAPADFDEQLPDVERSFATVDLPD